jgi:hypothetical protein
MEPRNSIKISSQLLADSGYTATSRTTQKTSHVIAKYCCSVTSLRLRGSVFTEPLPRSGLHTPVVPLLVLVLLRNGCFCGSTILACGKYAKLLFRNTYCYKRDYTRFHPVNEQSRDTCIPASGSPKAGTGLLPQTSHRYVYLCLLQVLPLLITFHTNMRAWLRENKWEDINVNNNFQN